MTRSMPEIGFVMPYFGREDLFQQAVLSVRAQTDERWSLHVLVDGPEPPPVEAWLDAQRDPRITHERNETNLGVSAGFQRCLERARTDHVVFLGCDDLLLPRYVEVVRRELRAWPRAAVLQPGVEVVDAAGTVVRPAADRIKRLLAPRASRAVSLRGEPLLTSLLTGNWTYFPSLCWRREVIVPIGFRIDLAVTLDLALLAQVVLDGGQLVTVPEKAFVYRRHAASVSSVTARSADRFDEEQRLFTELAAASRDQGWTRAARAARWHTTSRLHAASLVPGAVLAGDLAGARRLARHVGAQ